MLNNPYNIIGVSPEDSLDSITEVFNSKSNKLQELYFSEGDIGNNAVREMDILREAYNDIVQLKLAEVDNDADNNSNQYTNIKQLILDNELIEAQKYLDTQKARNGEWHYLQSVLYMKRGWLSECKRHLELAIKDGSNPEYISSYEKLIASRLDLFLDDYMRILKDKTRQGQISMESDVKENNILEIKQIPPLGNSPIRSYPPNTRGASNQPTNICICGKDKSDDHFC